MPSRYGAEHHDYGQLADLKAIIMLHDCIDGYNACAEILDFISMRILLIVLCAFSCAACGKRPLGSNMTGTKLNLELIQAYYYASTGHNILAAQIYRQALRLAPQAGALHNNYGVFLCRNGFYQRGIAQLQIAAHTPRYPQQRMARHNASRCWQQYNVVADKQR